MFYKRLITKLICDCCSRLKVEDKTTLRLKNSRQQNNLFSDSLVILEASLTLYSKFFK